MFNFASFWDPLLGVLILWSTCTRGYPPIDVSPITVAVPPIAVAAHLVTKNFCSDNEFLAFGRRCCHHVKIINDF